MVNYSQLLNMDTSKLSTAATTSGNLSKALTERAGEVGGKADIPAGMWAGLDAGLASSLISDQQSPLFDASDAFKRGQATLDDLVDGLQAAKERLADAHDLVAGTEVTIGPDGTVTTPPADNPTMANQNAFLARQAAEIIDDALRMANEADDKASAAVGEIDPASKKDIPNGKGDSAEDVKKWWDSLSKAEQDAYIKKFPKEIGNLDGIPAEARHEANMDSLRQDAKGGDNKFAKMLLDRIEDSRDGAKGDEIYLLGYEPGKGSDGKAIAAIGNPDTADHTAVNVPGTGTDLGNVAGGGLLANAADLRDQAMQEGNGSVSSIVWMGYDAPQGYVEAYDEGRALNGAGDLRDFTRGLDATNQGGDGHTTVIGHSYGSTVAGSADSRGMKVDDLVAVGSPGIGFEPDSKVDPPLPGPGGYLNSDRPSIENVDELNTDPNHVWAGASAGDPISYMSIHGANPAESDFGGERFATDGAGGHSEYYKEGTESLRNLGRIVAGEYDEVEHVDPR
ncbi:alpha/beta hydrolase [Stackebrandtia nassauensis]|uniref:DUF1023 domain-containing protein n=1 Tax=Stackebrandtia nassauensis (strain DSM 44728 / CIP 108903 / NRRL B-16338 / NBRC 102104 / LLR-40K-21) TaxID=446470 RepID=D3Q784_STANL|nr:alpha/beta hydrolase [Stackebrandtia nassauensis]ADD42355.1 protein of unknown function DUF1023 [Stackebrandtia nassauensis DSM 44728]